MLTKHEFEILNNAPEDAKSYAECDDKSVDYYSTTINNVYFMGIRRPTFKVDIEDLRKQHEDDLLIIKAVFRTRGYSVSAIIDNCIKEMSDHAGHAALIKYLIDLELNKMEEVKMNNCKPRTKTEYVKVTDSIFGLQSDFEKGELYFYRAGRYFKINTLTRLGGSYDSENINRKVETEITWQSELWDQFRVSYNKDNKSFEFGITAIDEDSVIELCRFVVDSVDGK